MNQLFLVATPIGNLEDISIRALECLRNADLIACEDTRHSRILLDHYDIHVPTTSYHEHNKYDKAHELVLELKRGKNIALITDAGTPGISDPGEELVKEALGAGISVTSVPGACAVITALSMCGLSSRRFVFEGFLDSDKKERKAALERIKDESRTIVIYEAPHRIKKTLAELKTVLGGSRALRICRELTKKFEEVLPLTIDEAIAYFDLHEAKGEMVVVIEGQDPTVLKEKNISNWENISPEEHLEHYLSQGLSEKEAMKELARDRGVSRRDIYKLLKIKDLPD